LSKYYRKVPTNKIRRPNTFNVRLSDLELLTLQKIAGDGDIAKIIRNILHTSERFRQAYKQLNQTFKQEVNNESILS